MCLIAGVGVYCCVSVCIEVYWYVSACVGVYWCWVHVLEFIGV